jgi:dihydroorotate dehydrogenase electron transfer subunit
LNETAENPLHASSYPDRAVHRTARITHNERIAHETYRVRIECPEIACRFLPGQFVMLRLASTDDPLLGRPMAIFDTAMTDNGEPAAFDVVYHVVGKMTSRLAHTTAGTELAVWGPLGNGFVSYATDHLLLVAGGIGQTPLLAPAQEALGHRVFGQPPRAATAVDRVTLCYGARHAGLLACVDDFRAIGVDVKIATEDGSAGQHGLVTQLVEPLLAESDGCCQVVGCGPQPMLRKLAEMTAAAGVACDVSLETPMACGIGICFSCVVRVRDRQGHWDYQRTCVDGPVFAADRIVW